MKKEICPCGAKITRKSPVGRPSCWCGACKKIARRAARVNYEARNPGKCKEFRKNWVKNNPEKKKAVDRKYYSRHYKAGDNFKLAKTCRNRIADALRDQGLKKTDRAAELLQMEIPEFRIYIQGQFRPGMTWGNHGPVWHLDHIIPCASFDLTDKLQRQVCFHWSNYQPLFAKENLCKAAKI